MSDLSKAKVSDATGPWSPYAPSQEAPWDLRRVVHLHRRAGLAATWNQIQRDLADGPSISVGRLLSGKAHSQAVPEGFKQTAEALADAAVASRDPDRLKAWWMYRMLFTPDPLAERLTLQWHNHFATSNLKVQNLAAMRRQNDLFRKLGRAPFATLLNQVVRDPALLNWLDAPANRKGHPNENLGRELMELFTLGISHYSETDVKEAARALTGWTVQEDAFQESPAKHDAGEKSILGHKGHWTGADLVRLLLDHPATVQRLALRLCEMFMGEKVVDAAGIKALAEGLRRHDLDIGWGVETVLRSQAFFADANLRTRIFGPVEFLIGSARALEMFDPPPMTLLLADWSARLGQDLFYPPNVGGWPGGRSWITPQTMIGRTNYGAELVQGTLFRQAEAFDALGLARRHGRGDDLRAALMFYGELLLGGSPEGDWYERLLALARSQAATLPETINLAVVLILASPNYQLA